MMENRKKRLLVTASTFPRWKDDTEPRFVLDLASYMSEEFDITVLVPMAVGAKEKEELKGVKIVRYHYFPIHKWETLCYPGAIVPRIKEKPIRILLVPCLFVSLYLNLLKMLPEFDVVHAHWIIPQGIVQSFFKQPYIVTGHGGDVTSLNRGIFKLLKKRCLKRAKYITVVSKHLKQQIVKYDIKTKLEIIPMGCNLNEFGKQFYVDNFFQQNGKKVVLFVGRLAEKKGVAYLIEAIRNLDIILVIVGNGPLEQQLMEQAKDILDKVKFLGAKTHQELRTIYASADVMVVPSITAKDGDQEGLGLVILEAMASGIPVIASDSGGISDVIKDARNGLLFEERNVKQMKKQIQRVLEDEKLYWKLCLHANETVTHFDYEKIAQRYINNILGC